MTITKKHIKFLVTNMQLTHCAHVLSNLAAFIVKPTLAHSSNTDIYSPIDI